MSEGKKPVLELRAFPLKAAAWENPGKDGHPWYSVKLTRVYKDAQGKWQETQSLNDRDLLAASALLLEVWRTLAVKEGAPEKKAASPASASAVGADDDHPF